MSLSENHAFLGYVPFDVDVSTLGGQIKLYRYLHGLSQENLALKLNINEANVNDYENNKHKPMPKTYEKLKSLRNYVLIRNRNVYKKRFDVDLMSGRENTKIPPILENTDEQVTPQTI